MLVLETAGTPQTVALAIEAAGPRAQLALVGTLHHASCARGPAASIANATVCGVPAVSRTNWSN
jgi:threonine dehydrogenase-like Zn-dependent dehydrogenase